MHVCVEGELLPGKVSSVLFWGYPAGGANLEATGEELQSCVELSVVVETLQSCQTLQTYLSLLRDRGRGKKWSSSQVQ